MALLDMLKNLQAKKNFQLMAAHFNHQLREDSEEESELLKKYCDEKNVPLFIAKWPKEEQPQVGIEAAARHARYAFLTQIAKENKADYLLTAHHGDDLLENILLKFIRSGNPEEMNSLQRVGEMHGVKLLRPLLGYSKDELLQYNQAHRIDFITDSTNQADETMRNRLRHHVVPLLKKENPALIKNALFFSQKMDELIDYVDEKNIAVGQLERFLNVAYRIKSEKLKRLTTKERTFFWQRMIWQKYHRRVNENLGNFAVIEYQNYFYLYKKQNISEVKKQVISLNQPFVFKNRKMVLYTERKAGIKLIGDFWFKPNTAFSVGELTAGNDLGPLRDVLAQTGNILVIDLVNAIDAEAADLLAAAAHGTCGARAFVFLKSHCWFTSCLNFSVEMDAQNGRSSLSSMTAKSSLSPAE